jgi:aspartyl-tRNA(Asn)/glutamyl-tRNA(Gln) amidotransferase subunit C
MNREKEFDVHKIAGLARLELTESEEINLKNDLQKIVGYIDQMSELDVEDIKPTAHAVPLVNVYREDIPGKSFEKETMLKNAPSLIEEELIQVHQVVDSH